jgi:hypothetical protein
VLAARVNDGERRLNVDTCNVARDDARTLLKLWMIFPATFQSGKGSEMGK